MAIPYSTRQLKEDQLAGLFVAAILSALAGFAFALATLGNIVQMVRGRSPEVPWATLGAARAIRRGVAADAGAMDGRARGAAS